MNKYLMLSAAALVATTAGTTSSMAGSGSVHLTAKNGSVTYCDTYTVTWSGVNYADVVDWTPCSISSHSDGMGISGKTKGFKGGKKGANVAISDDYVGDVSAGFAVDWQFGLPFKSGNAFNAYYTTNGTTVTQYIAGTYVIGARASHSKISTADALPRRVKR